MSLIQRYANPLTGLKENFAIKAVLAVLGSLFASDPQLVALVVILVVMDFLTGVYAAKVRKETINSKGFRQTVVKVIEYFFLLAGCTAVANSFDIINWIDEIAYMFTALTELKSIVENITSSESPARRIWMMVRREMNRRGDVVFDPEAAKDANYITNAPKIMTDVSNQPLSTDLTDLTDIANESQLP